jgi:hypothetical protein
MGWQKDYSLGSGSNYATVESPVGVYSKIEHATLVGEEMPLAITIQSIEDTELSEISILAIQKTKGEIPVDNLVFKGETSWKGGLKNGVPVQISSILKFPEEGDWEIEVMVRANPGSVKHGMARISMHVGKEKSWFGWLVDHYNPDLYKPAKVSPADTSEGIRPTQQ